jgi:hypothetical protein
MTTECPVTIQIYTNNKNMYRLASTQKTHTITKMDDNINMESTTAEQVNDNINMESTTAEQVNDNINMDSIISGSMNDKINMDSTISGSMNVKHKHGQYNIRVNE